MEVLYQKSCTEYLPGEPAINNDTANELMLNIPNWSNERHKGIETLVREFYFLRFNDAFNFTSKIFDLAEKENHHPKIILEWGKVTVYWWSHKVNGLHINDFIMAAKTDMIITSFEKN